MEYIQEKGEEATIIARKKISKQSNMQRNGARRTILNWYPVKGSEMMMNMNLTFDSQTFLTLVKQVSIEYNIDESFVNE